MPVVQRPPEPGPNGAASTPDPAVEPQPATPPEPPPLVRLDSLFDAALERAERRRSGAEIPVPIPWEAWRDALGGGFWPGLHVIISGTGAGKSQLTIQTSIAAAKAGIPAVYIGLELEADQIALRAIGDVAGIRWSNLYLGRCSEDDLRKARAAANALKGLPFYTEFSSGRGWPASRLVPICERARMDHPEGPLLVVLDYLQLVGDDAGPFERRPDVRERISDAAVKGRDVARRFDAAVVLISSAARMHYQLLDSDVREAGLISRAVPDQYEPARQILKPSILMGLGKESGEVEFCADSVTTLIRWPTRLDSGETAIIAACPKIRSMPASWCALAFNGGRFRELTQVASVDDLPAPPEAPAKAKQPPKVDARVARVFETLRNASAPIMFKTELAEAVGGKRQLTLKFIDAMFKTGALIRTDEGIQVGQPDAKLGRETS